MLKAIALVVSSCTAGCPVGCLEVIFTKPKLHRPFTFFERSNFTYTLILSKRKINKILDYF